MNEVQEFAERLNAALISRHRHEGAGREYVLVDHLRAAVARALVPPGEESRFPLMLYFGGSREQTCVVANEAEEAAAIEAGYVAQPLPQFEEGYPQQWVECGKVWDWRTVRLNNSEEKRLFQAITDPDAWTPDDYQRGGRGVSLDALAEEHRELLRQVISQQPLVASDTPVAATEEGE